VEVVGLRPIMRLVTFVAVLDMAVVGSIEVGVNSSTDDACSGGIDCATALALPKVNFHLDGFLVTGAVGGAGNSLLGGGCFLARALNKGVGIAYIVTGSCMVRLVRDVVVVDVLVPTD